MLNLDHIQLILSLKNITHYDLSVTMKKADGTNGVSRPYVSGLLVGSEPMTEGAYRRLMEAVNNPETPGAWQRQQQAEKKQTKAPK